MSEHTKTPWEVLGVVDMFISTEDGAIIADVSGSVTSHEEDRANAKHICHCVNHHDNLVEALEKIANEPLGLVSDKEIAKQALAEAKENEK